MTDDDLRAELDRLRQPGVEGYEDGMYLDNANPPKGPNVTTGIGYLLHDVDAALALPWLRRADGGMATADEVRADWERVTSMRGGLPATRYRGPLVLSAEAIEA